MIPLKTQGFRFGLPRHIVSLQLVILLLFMAFALVTSPLAKAQDAPADGIEVAAFQFSGNTLFSDAELLQVIQTNLGQHLTFQELEKVVERITRLYRDAGYIGSLAYIPEQHIVGGGIRIAVLEVRYGRIDVHNASRLREHVVAGQLATLQPGDFVDGTRLEQRIATLSGMPGVRARSTLSPGETPGTTDLTVTVTDTSRLTGQASVSNAGTRLTGNLRLGVAAQLNNAAGLGDLLSINGTTGGSGFLHAQFGYELPLGTLPLRVGMHVSQVEYKLGAEFAALNATGRTQQIGLTLKAPLRIYDKTWLDWQVDIHHKQITDRLVGSAKEKDIARITATLAGQHGGSLSLPGVRGLAGRYIVAGTTGQLRILSPTDLVIDQATAKTNGTFQKLNATYALSAAVGASTEVFGSLSGQMAFKNLDLTEKFTLGGPEGVRAYPSGEASGDEGMMARLELRHHHILGGGHRLQGVLFTDMGHVRFNKDPFDPAATNQRSLFGAGLGLQWTFRAFTVSSQYAWRLGPELATADEDRGGRFWMQAEFRF